MALRNLALPPPTAQQRRRRRTIAPCLCAAVLLWLAGGVALLGAPPSPGVVVRAPEVGAFLVASRSLLDPNFAHTVVLLLEHGKEGSMGVVVNRPTPMRAADVLEVEGIEDRQDLLYAGGPVGVPNLLVLSRDDQATSHGTAVLKDVTLIGEREELEGLIRRDVPSTALRLLVGYAGWAPGQLEAEIARGDWLIVGAGARWVFSDQPDRLWDELFQLASLRSV